MAEQPSQQPVPSVSRAREIKIAELSQHFANDDLSLEDLEQRIERVYKAGSLAELDSITADLRLAPATSPTGSGQPSTARERLVAAAAARSAVADYPVEHSRMLAIMSSTRRVGRWAAPRGLDVLAIMSDTHLDLTQALLPAGGVVDLRLNAVMASFRIVVPPGMRVVNQMHSIMSEVRSDADEVALPGSASAPIVRLSGMAFMSNLRVKVRRREQLADYDED